MIAFSVLHSADEWQSTFPSTGPRTTLTVGNFDGLHLGHQQILRETVRHARTTGTVAAAITFDPHPLKVLRPAQAPLLVETLAQRLSGIESMGLDAVLILRFDTALAALSAEEFVRAILVRDLRTSAVLVGQNFRFGHKQAGDVTLLAKLGTQLGFVVEIIPPVVTGEGVVVSSTAIRRAIAEGRPTDATSLLGRPFALTGPIEQGSGRGGTILFPTLNLRPEQELLPKAGVYATQVQVAGRLYGAATNVGFRPTFDGVHLTVESHLFDFSQVLTSGRMEVRFWDRLRDERKFGGPSELRAQIASDLLQAQSLLKHLAPTQSPQRV